MPPACTPEPHTHTQASSNVPGNVDAVRALTKHPAFNMSNPNNCYSLFLAFVMSPVNFHAEDGSGYAFMVDSILAVSGHCQPSSHALNHACKMPGCWTSMACAA